METSLLETLGNKLRALNDEDLEKMIAKCQEEKEARQLPEVQVTFHGLSGEVVHQCFLKRTLLILDVKKALLPHLHTDELDTFDLLCQEQRLHATHSLRMVGSENSEGSGPFVLQMLRCHPRITLKRRMHFPRVYQARRNEMPTLEPFVVQSPHGTAVANERVFQSTQQQTQQTTLWRHIDPSSSPTAAVIVSNFSPFKKEKKNPVVAMMNVSALDVSFFADILEGGQVLYSLKKDHSADSLSQWPNAKPLREVTCSGEPCIDIFLAECTSGGEVEALLEYHEQLLHPDAFVLLCVSTDDDWPESFFTDCVHRVRFCGLKPLEQLQLKPHLPKSSLIVATNTTNPNAGYGFRRP